MGSGAAVGIDDYLASCETAVPHGAADDEPACGVDEEFCILIYKPRGYGGLYDRINNCLPQLLRADIRGVLGGDDHRAAPGDVPVAVVLDGHLGLSVRADPVQLAALAHSGKAL